MTVMIGRLVSGPRMMEIVDLELASADQIKPFCADMMSAFGIESLTLSEFSLPQPLSPEELREQNRLAGQRLNLQQE
jgi:hypothetical protein